MNNATLVLVLSLVGLSAARAQTPDARVLTLDDAIEIALEQSYDVREERYELESAEKSLEAVKRGLMTSLNLELDAPEYVNQLKSQFNTETGAEEFFKVENTTVEGTLSLDQPIVFTDGRLSLFGTLLWRDQNSELGAGVEEYYTDVGVRLVQPLFTFNDLGADLERAEIRLERTRRNYLVTEQDIVFRVTSAFYAAYQAGRRLDIAREKLEQTEASFETGRNKFKAGLVPESEALQLEVEYAASRNEVLDAETRVSDALNELKLALGMEIEEPIDVVAEIEFAPVEIDRERAIAFALERRPEIENARDNVRLQELEVEETSDQGDVQANLIANYGINKNDELIDELWNDFAQNRSVTLNVRLPLWDWGQNRLRTEAAIAELKIAQLRIEEERKGIVKDAISLLDRLESAKARVALLEKSLDVARRSYDISANRFAAGQITGFELSQTQLRLTETRLDHLSALIDYRTALADLKRRTLYDFEKQESVEPFYKLD
ncbi:MAG: hypothetical protein GF419_12615 [Ignavibacteriales bacterium]|nr:hypothetical protein [Ignavibacteriales bacterium]